MAVVETGPCKVQLAPVYSKQDSFPKGGRLRQVSQGESLISWNLSTMQAVCLPALTQLHTSLASPKMFLWQDGVRPQDPCRTEKTPSSCRQSLDPRFSSFSLGPPILEILPSWELPRLPTSSRFMCLGCCGAQVLTEGSAPP